MQRMFIILIFHVNTALPTSANLYHALHYLPLESSLKMRFCRGKAEKFQINLLCLGKEKYVRGPKQIKNHVQRRLMINKKC